MPKATKRETVLVKVHMQRNLHARLKSLAALRQMVIGDVVAEVLDKHLPKGPRK